MAGKLPADILSTIACKLTNISDFIRFRGVCRSWRSAARPVDSPPPSSPLLLLSHDPDGAARCFFNLATDTYRVFDFPEARGKHVLGSAYGWLALTDARSCFSLWNPVTGTHIPLPPPAGFPACFRPSAAIDLFCCGSMCDFGYSRRVFLSSKPAAARDSNCMVAVTTASSKLLAFCRLGDAAWTVLDVGLPAEPCSVLFHEGRILVFTFEGYGLSVDTAGRNAIPIKKPMFCLPIIPRTLGLFVLKTAADEIFMVMDHPCEIGMMGKLRGVIHVLKLDTSDLSWTEVSSIGNLSFFLSGNHASAVDASESPGCYQDYLYFGSKLCSEDTDGWRSTWLFTRWTDFRELKDVQYHSREADYCTARGESFCNSNWFTFGLS